MFSVNLCVLHVGYQKTFKTLPCQTLTLKVPRSTIPFSENMDDGTIRSIHSRGHIEKWLYKDDENINGEIVEHVVVEGHPYELVVRTCWQMDGADKLKYPYKL